jgi:hypothetical protein
MRFLPVVVALLVAACGNDGGGDDSDVDCTKVSGADTFVVGLPKDGSSGALDFAMMSAEPSPPARGDNTWIVSILDMNGQPFAGANLTVTPFMPAHQHGTPITVGVTPVAGTPGQYTLSPVNLWMPGVWETTIRATSADTTTSDSALYTFCIN